MSGELFDFGISPHGVPRISNLHLLLLYADEQKITESANGYGM
jgi:hypothetical protein